MSQKFEALKSAVTQTIENLKTAAQNKFNEMKTNVVNTVENIKSQVSSKMTAMKDAVVHAYWIVEKESDSFGDHYRTYYTCSRCNHVTFKGWNFCPDCGAKMDK